MESASFLSILKYIICIIIVSLVHKLVLRPYLLIRHYKIQGLQESYYFPFIGILRLYFKGSKNERDIMGEIRKIGKRNPNCKGVVYNIRGEVAIAFTDPEYRKEFFAKQSEYFIKRNSSFIYFSRLWGRENILVSEGEQWKIRRRMISQVFQFENLKSSVQVVLKNADIVLGEFEKKEGGAAPFDAMKEFQTITGNSFIEVFFGEEIHKVLFEGQPVSFMISQLLVELGKLLLTKDNVIFGSKISSKYFLTKKKRALFERVQTFRAVILDFIKNQMEKRASSDAPGNARRLFEVLREALRNEKLNQGGVSEEEFLLNEFIVLFAAGTDTTGLMKKIINMI